MLLFQELCVRTLNGVCVWGGHRPPVPLTLFCGELILPSAFNKLFGDCDIQGFHYCWFLLLLEEMSSVAVRWCVFGLLIKRTLNPAWSPLLCACTHGAAHGSGSGSEATWPSVFPGCSLSHMSLS